MAASILGFLIFVCDYGLLFWAEQRVPSGIAAVVLATIPVFIALCEIVLMRTQRLTVRLAVALLVGIAGVAVLVNHSFNLGDAPIDTLGAAALIVAAFSWSISTVLTRQDAAAGFKADEFCRADADRRRDADGGVGDRWAICAGFIRGSLSRRVVRTGLL